MERDPNIHVEPTHTHEHSDMSISAILWFAGGLAVTTIIVQVVLSWLFTFYEHSRDYGAPVSPFAASRQLPPAPRLQVYPPGELRDFRMKEDKVLTTYGWEDKSKGVVRIPIDRAIDMVAQSGLPATKPGAAMKNSLLGTTGDVNTPTGTSVAPGNPASLPFANVKSTSGSIR